MPPMSTSELLAENSAKIKPEFIRIPKKGSFCPYTGLGCDTIFRLVTPCKRNGFKPPVRSVSLRPRGSARGTRLVNYDSLMAYLNSQTATAE